MGTFTTKAFEQLWQDGLSWNKLGDTPMIKALADVRDIERQDREMTGIPPHYFGLDPASGPDKTSMSVMGPESWSVERFVLPMEPMALCRKHNMPIPPNGFCPSCDVEAMRKYEDMQAAMIAAQSLPVSSMVDETFLNRCEKHGTISTGDCCYCGPKTSKSCDSLQEGDECPACKFHGYAGKMELRPDVLHCYSPSEPMRLVCDCCGEDPHTIREEMDRLSKKWPHMFEPKKAPVSKPKGTSHPAPTHFHPTPCRKCRMTDHANRPRNARLDSPLGAAYALRQMRRPGRSLDFMPESRFKILVFRVFLPRQG